MATTTPPKTNFMAKFPSRLEMKAKAARSVNIISIIILILFELGCTVMMFTNSKCNTGLTLVLQGISQVCGLVAVVSASLLTSKDLPKKIRKFEKKHVAMVMCAMLFITIILNGIIIWYIGPSEAKKVDDPDPDPELFTARKNNNNNNNNNNNVDTDEEDLRPQCIICNSYYKRITILKSCIIFCSFLTFFKQGIAYLPKSVVRKGGKDPNRNAKAIRGQSMLENAIRAPKAALANQPALETY